MKVSSKFDVGDEVWYISNNKVESNRVRKVCIKVGSHIMERQTVTYELYHFGEEFREGQLFGTKDELLKSL